MGHSEIGQAIEKVGSSDGMPSLRVRGGGGGRGARLEWWDLNPFGVLQNQAHQLVFLPFCDILS